MRHSSEWLVQLKKFNGKNFIVGIQCRIKFCFVCSMNGCECECVVVVSHHHSLYLSTALSTVRFS